MKAPRVSVIMAVYNGEAFVGEAVDSVLRQTFADFELIVVDDGSTDATSEILGGFSDRRLQVRRISHSGLTAARSEAFRLTRAEHQSFIDADDVYEPDYLERKMALAQKHPDLAMIGCGAFFIDAEGRSLERVEDLSRYPEATSRFDEEEGAWFFEPLWQDEALQRLLLRDNRFGYSGSLFRTEVLRTIGAYRRGVEWAQDYDLYLRICELHRVALLMEPLYRRRWHGGNKSILHLDTQQRAARRWRELCLERICRGYDGLGYAPPGEAYARIRKRTHGWRGRRERSKRLARWALRMHRMHWDRGRTGRFLLRSLLCDPLNLESWRMVLGLASGALRRRTQQLAGERSPASHGRRR